MKKVAAVVLATAMTVPLITGCGAVTVPSESTAETTVKELGPARAQDDYFRFINQERFDTSEFKYGENTVEVAFKTDLIDEQIEKIIDDCAAGKGYAKGSEEDLIKYAYESFNSYDFDNTPIPADPATKDLFLQSIPRRAGNFSANCRKCHFFEALR